MTTIAERARQLGRVQSFDSDAFRGDKEVPQELCDLILAFALVFNDVRDVMLWHEDLLKEAPADMARKRNRFFAEHGGTSVHSLRLVASIVHELGELIRKNSQILNHPFFINRVLKHLSRTERERWERVRSLAFEKKADKPMDSLLEYLRNKTTYHYDSADLRDPFNERFPSGSELKTQQPCLSRADQPRKMRFFFADAVALQIVEEGAEARGLTPLGEKMTPMITDLMVTLGRIIEEFIQRRSGWRDFLEET